jgi:hypothetical protein
MVAEDKARSGLLRRHHGWPGAAQIGRLLRSLIPAERHHQGVERVECGIVIGCGKADHGDEDQIKPQQ